MVTMVLSTATLLGCIGLAIDAGYLQLLKIRMQTAADAAAIGGAQEYRMNGSAAVTAAAQGDAALNGFTNGTKSVSVTVNSPPLSGFSTGDPMAVEVIISQPTGTFFMSVLGLTSATVRARSVARLPTVTSCVMATDPAASGALTLSGGAIVTTGCGVAADSTSPSALSLTGGSQLTAAAVTVAGNYSLSGGSTVSPPPIQGGAPDPLFYVQPPAVGACDFKNYNASGKGTTYMVPGVYCGGITVEGNATVSLAPGTYILLGDGMTLKGGAIMAGTGVTFYNTFDSTHPYGAININGGAIVTLSAPPHQSHGRHAVLPGPAGRGRCIQLIQWRRLAQLHRRSLFSDHFRKLHRRRGGSVHHFGGAAARFLGRRDVPFGLFVAGRRIAAERVGGIERMRTRTKGTALVEFALVAPLLLLVLAGVLDYGMALRTASSVASAARAGAQYGSMSPGNAADTAGIRNAALNAAPGVSGLNISSARSCQCSGGGAVDCTASCSTGRMLVYVQVTAQTTVSTIFNYGALGFFGSTSSQANMRAQ